MSDERQSNPAMALPPLLRTPKYQEAYANALKIKLTATDCAIVFGTTPDMPGIPGLVQEEVTIYMTHSLLKVLSRYLNSFVSALEAELGPIKVPISATPKEEDISSIRESLRRNPLAE
jgi:hypothetical protein